MKKVLLIASIVVVLLALIMPAAVGVMVENQFRRLAANVETTSLDYRWVVDEYERGWFSSRARYHLEPANELGARLLESEEGANLAFPVLTSDARIFHGPLFFAAAGNPGVSMLPALAHSIDSLSVISPDGTQTALPGSAHTRLGLFARHSNVIDIEKVSLPFAVGAKTAVFDWGGMKMTTRFNSDLDELAIDAVINAFKLELPEMVFISGQTVYEGTHFLTEHGFWAGDQSGSFSGFSSFGADGLEIFSMGELIWNVSVSVAGGATRQSAELELKVVEMGGTSFGPISLSFEIKDLDAAATGELIADVRHMVMTDDSRDEFQLAALLEDLLSRGPALSLETFNVDTPDGRISLQANASIPELAQKSLPLMLARIEASANLRVPARLVERLRVYNPEAYAQVQAVIAAGLLQIKDDYLVMEAIAKGPLLTVNGQPLPLPGAF